MVTFSLNKSLIINNYHIHILVYESRQVKTLFQITICGTSQGHSKFPLSLIKSPLKKKEILGPKMFVNIIFERD